DDGRAGGHRLEHGDAEALVERGIGDAEGAAVEPAELFVGDLAEPADVTAARVHAAPPAGARDPQLDAQPGRRRDRPRDVLAWFERPDGEHVVALGAGAV